MVEFTAGAPHSPRRSSLARALGLATLIQVVATASVLAMTAIAPHVAADLGIGAHWIGYQISLIYTAGMISSAVAGTLVARYGPIRVEQVALACFAFGLAGISSGSISLIVLASLAIGLGYGLNNPAASEILSEVTPAARRNIVYSVKQSGVPLGGILASFAFPYLASHFGWHAALLGSALVPACVLVMLIGAYSAPVAGRKVGSWLAGFVSEQTSIMRNARLAALSCLGFAYSAMQLSLSAFAVVALVHDAGWTILAAGSVAAAMQFSGVCGRIFWGAIADRIGGGFVTLAMLGLLGGIGYIGLFWLSSMPPIALTALLIAMGFVTIGWNGVLLAEVAHNAPAARVGATTGGVLVYTFLGVIVGPSGFALLFAASGSYGTSFLAYALFGFLGMAVAWRARRHPAAPQ